MELPSARFYPYAYPSLYLSNKQINNIIQDLILSTSPLNSLYKVL